MTQPDDRDQKTTPREVPMEKHEQGHTLGDRGTQQQQQGSPKPGGSTQQGGARNEGEGNRTAAKQYNAHVQQSAANPAEVQREAEAARKALDGADGADLKKAEDAGRKPARR